MNELEDSFDLNDDDFDLGDDLGDVGGKVHKPKKSRQRKPHQVIFPNAVNLAEKTQLRENDRYDVLVDGSFIFGDYLHALLTRQQIGVKKMCIATLSMSSMNVDSLEALIQKGYIKNLDLIVSDYFYSHERNAVIKECYDKLTINDDFQLSVARNHSKVTLFETLGGKKIVIHGSANLRSADNIEQFTIEINEDLYNFYFDFYSKIIEEYKTINKSLTNKQLRSLY